MSTIYFIYTENEESGLALAQEVELGRTITLADCNTVVADYQAKYPSHQVTQFRIGFPHTHYYYVSSNTLRIYKDDSPIYENANGIICSNPAALGGY